MRRLLSSYRLLLAAALVPCLSIGAHGQETESCRFRYRPPQVGEDAQQTVESNLQLTVSMQMSGQVIDSFDQKVDRKHSRHLTVLRSNEDRILLAKVTYQATQLTTTTKGEPAPVVEHPIVGKTYLVARPEKDGELSITYEDGTTPPEQELAVVRANVDGIGRPNKLGQYFHGRTVKIGQVLQLPNELANEVMGLRDAVGKVTRFEMRLVGTRQIKRGGQDDSSTTAKPPIECAVIEIAIDAGQPEKEGMKLQVRGEVVMEINTCRTHAAKFGGPVAVTELRGPPGHQFTVAGHGKMNVAIRSDHADVRR
jgi:hypothetical protein